MKSRTESLFKDSLILSIGDLGSKLLIFALVPFFTFYLSSVEYGKLDLIQVTITLLIPLITLSVYEATLRFVLDGENAKVVFSNGAIVIVLGVIFSGLCLVIYSILMGIPDFYYLVFLVFCLNMFYIYLLNFCRSLKKLKLYALNSLLYSVSLFMGVVFLVGHFQYGLHGFFIANIISYLLSLAHLFGGINIRSYLSVKVLNLNTIIQMLSYSLPLMPNSLMWWIINASSRYLILFFLGTSFNGLFAVSSKLSGIIAVFNSIFFKAWQLSAIEHKDSKDSGKYNLVAFQYFSSFIFLLVSILIIIVKPLFSTLGEEYIKAWKYTPLLLIAVVFSSLSSFLGTNYIVNKNTKDIFYTSLIGAGVTLVLNVLLIPIMGLYGVGFSSIAGFLTMSIIRWRSIVAYKKETKTLHTILLNLISVSIITIITYLTIPLYFSVFLYILGLMIMIKINKKFIFFTLAVLKKILEKLVRRY
ncbi:hypothetical protein JY98_08815 [Exiguobacterium mexicanum]|nr:hypothetical protein JY98_08815 [Exiguobacterium mexicanum]